MQGPVEVPQIRAKPQKPDPRKRCSPEDLRGVFARAQHAVLAGRDFDADSEAARCTSLPTMRLHTTARRGARVQYCAVNRSLFIETRCALSIHSMIFHLSQNDMR